MNEEKRNEKLAGLENDIDIKIKYYEKELTGHGKNKLLAKLVEIESHYDNPVSGLCLCVINYGISLIPLLTPIIMGFTTEDMKQKVKLVLIIEILCLIFYYTAKYIIGSKRKYYIEKTAIQEVIGNPYNQLVVARNDNEGYEN